MCNVVPLNVTIKVPTSSVVVSRRGISIAGQAIAAEEIVDISHNRDEAVLTISRRTAVRLGVPTK